MPVTSIIDGNYLIYGIVSFASSTKARILKRLIIPDDEVSENTQRPIYSNCAIACSNHL